MLKRQKRTNTHVWTFGFSYSFDIRHPSFNSCHLIRVNWRDSRAYLTQAGIILRFLVPNVIVHLLLENLERQGAILEHSVVKFALVEFRAQFVLCACAQFLNL
jgi:hypothetical protein